MRFLKRDLSGYWLFYGLCPMCGGLKHFEGWDEGQEIKEPPEPILPCRCKDD